MVTALIVLLSLQAAPSPARVEFETTLGAFIVEIDLASAPATSANFLKYVDAGLYDGGRFHRTVRPDNETRSEVPIQVVQAAMAPGRRAERMAAIALERTSATGLKHVDGAISMARTEVADSARDEFFICVGDQPLLDEGGGRARDGHGYAVFGRVTSGMDVIRRIHQAPAVRQTLTPPVGILKARRIS
jgi:peptidyl-prolyl cis-trans isomerase A (cyclophilin A)